MKTSKVHPHIIISNVFFLAFSFIVPLKLNTKLVKYVFDSVYLHIPNDEMKIMAKNSEFSHKISLGKIATVGQISLFSI